MLVTVQRKKVPERTGQRAKRRKEHAQTKDVLYVKMFVEMWLNDGCDLCNKMYVKRKRCV
jgi:hypothetical protein